MTKKQKFAKWLVRNIVSISAGYVVAEALKNNVETDSKRDKAQVYIGASAIGYLVSDAVADHTDKFVDDLFDAFNTITSKDTSDEIEA